ncbi:MAG: tetratricopeptide repeat protein, partial [Chloroflexota bacterium]
GVRPADAHYQIGRVLEIQRDYDGALAHYEQSLRLVPAARVHTRRGVLHALRGNREAALHDFAQATTGEQPDAGGFFYRAMLRFDERNYDAALEDLAAALELDPDHANAYREQGVIYALRGRQSAAINAFTEAVKRNPEDHEAFYYRANAYDASGDAVSALADYNAALDLHTDNAHYYYRRGKVRFSAEAYAEVIPDMAAAIALDDTIADAHFLLALCLMQHAEDYAGAISRLTRALELDPDNADIKAGLRIAQEKLDGQD